MTSRPSTATVCFTLACCSDTNQIKSQAVSLSCNHDLAPHPQPTTRSAPTRHQPIVGRDPRSAPPATLSTTNHFCAGPLPLPLLPACCCCPADDCPCCTAALTVGFIACAAASMAVNSAMGLGSCPPWPCAPSPPCPSITPSPSSSASTPPSTRPSGGGGALLPDVPTHVNSCWSLSCRNEYAWYRSSTVMASYMARRSRRHSGTFQGTCSFCRCVSRPSQYALSFMSDSWRVMSVVRARASSRRLTGDTAMSRSTATLASSAS
mmetsp:Transcript_1371/g.3740  ORF Transcript_1371/g.3740 Transcript_1371/m.3740 type:complete len:264 (-) Transcript_1371:3540-4331(-)